MNVAEIRQVAAEIRAARAITLPTWARLARAHVRQACRWARRERWDMAAAQCLYTRRIPWTNTDLTTQRQKPA